MIKIKTKTNMFTKEQIKQWLDKMGVENYTINKNLTVDVDGSVDLFNKLFR